MASRLAPLEEMTRAPSSLCLPDKDTFMRAVKPNVSIRELLEKAVSNMTTAALYEKRQNPKPWDHVLMPFLTQSDQANPFMLVIGENYLDEVQKHAYYYSTILGKKCWYLCNESAPMACMLSMLSLSSGIPKDVLQKFSNTSAFLCRV